MLEAGGCFLVGVDLAVAEVPDEQIAGIAAERGRRCRETPGRVELAVLRSSCQQVAGEIVGVDEAAAFAGDLVMLLGVLLRVRDEDARADRLDPERRVAVG